VQVPGIREITGIPKVVKAFMKVLVGRILSSREKENTDPKKQLVQSQEVKENFCQVSQIKSGQFD
jgi:hypothetical protein